MSLADSNLLAGLMAVEMKMVNADQFVVALKCALESGGSLDEILAEQQALNTAQKRMLEDTISEYVDVKGWDTKKCLETMSALSPGESTDAGSDPRTDRTLSVAPSGSAGPGVDVEATASFSGNSPGESRFKILRPHARGGLGEVFVARDEELNREVALKEIMRPLADRPEVKARFVAEAEITGGLEHPGIVPVYGLGHYADGRPYYAMRFIRGDSLKEAIANYHQADSAKREATDRTLELRKLLGRFIDVCDAIEYAHSRGVLHRDLKPGNIMLGKYGETLVVDWGLAKSVNRAELDPLGEPPLAPVGSGSAMPTRMGSIIGTPAYMSPEQATGRLDLVGPASDVYSLGATLYCLLTGQAPFGEGDLKTGLSKVQQGKFRPPRAVDATVTKPLEAICLKAMAHKPADRYATPKELAEDLEKWLADEPIAAMEEALPARAGRWLRKHKTAASASLAASLLIALTAVTAAVFINGYRHAAETQRVAAVQLAEKNLTLASAERAAHETAETRRQQAETVTDFVINTFRSPHPGRAGRSITVAEMLDRSARELLEGELTEDAVLRASLADAIGTTYRGLSMFGEAANIHRLAVQLREHQLGPRHPQTLSSANELAMDLFKAGEIDEAVADFERTLALREEVLGPKHFATTASLINLATVYQDQGDLQRAIPMFEQALQTREEILGPNDLDTLVALNNLGLAYCLAGRLDEAVPLLEANLARKRALAGDDNHSTIISMINLGDAYASAGKVEEAISLLQEAVQRRTVIHGEDDLATLEAMAALGAAFNTARRWDEAILLMERVLAGYRVKLSEDHPETLKMLKILANIYRNADQLPKAQAILEQEYELRERRGTNDPQTLRSLVDLAWAHKLSGSFAQAELLLLDAVERSREHLGADDDTTLRALDNLYMTYQAQQKHDLAHELIKRGLELREARFGEDHRETLTAMGVLAKSLQSSGRHAEAIPWYQRLFDILLERDGETAASTLQALNNLGYAHHISGDSQTAIPILERAWLQRQQQLGESNVATTTTLRNLGFACRAAGDLSRAMELQQLLVDRNQTANGPRDRRTLSAIHNLGRTMLAAGELEQCEQLSRELVAIRREQKPVAQVALGSDLAMLGACLLEQQRFADAEPILRETLQLRVATSQTSWLHANAQSLLGASLSGQGRFEDAQPLLLQGYQGMVDRTQQIPASQRSQRLGDAVQRLIKHYVSQELDDEATQWRNKLSEMEEAVN